MFKKKTEAVKEVQSIQGQYLLDVGLQDIEQSDRGKEQHTQKRKKEVEQYVSKKVF
jgi:hypothetical protein